jgi:hypothetical protein
MELSWTWMHEGFNFVLFDTKGSKSQAKSAYLEDALFELKIITKFV